MMKFRTVTLGSRVRMMGQAMFVLMGMVFGAPASAGVQQVLIDTRINAQIASEAEEVLLPYSQLEYDLFANNRLSRAERDAYEKSSPGIGKVVALYALQYDPLINVRVEIENNSQIEQYFSLQIRFETEATSGLTFKDAFGNIELIDQNENQLAQVRNLNAWFEVIDDPGTDPINGASNLAQAYFFTKSEPGTATLFDVTGTGPNADAFGGALNFMRFAINGSLGAGDKLVFTGMGAYATNAATIPDRYEIPALVPEPTSLAPAALGAALCLRRRRKW